MDFRLFSSFLIVTDDNITQHRNEKMERGWREATANVLQKVLWLPIVFFPYIPMKTIKTKEFMFRNRTGVMRVRSIHHIVDG